MICLGWLLDVDWFLLCLNLIIGIGVLDLILLQFSNTVVECLFYLFVCNFRLFCSLFCDLFCFMNFIVSLKLLWLS